MRFAPVSIALSALAAVTASTGQTATVQVIDPRALTLESEGRKALAAGDLDGATDGFEAALAVQPGAGRLVMDLADVARRQGMQGKALHYYRAVLAMDPQDLGAIAGEGEALAEKGAIEKARTSLAKLQGLCGSGCDESRALATAIAGAEAKAAAPKVVRADPVSSTQARLTAEPTVEVK